jgi:hypothetical protein
MENMPNLNRKLISDQSDHLYISCKNKLQSRASSVIFMT